MTPKEYALSIFNLLPPGVEALAFIGGGCFRSLYDGTKVKDIDLFFSSYDNFTAASRLFESDPRFTEQSENCLNGGRIFTDGVNPPYNLVGFRFHKDTASLMADFDFTCVTCAAEMVEPGVVVVSCGPRFVEDATSKTLRFHKVQNFARSSKRVERYVSYGYTRALSITSDLLRSHFIPAPTVGGDY